MKFVETKLKGAFIIEAEKFEDERGYFVRHWSDRDFEAAGLDARLVECNGSFNRRKGTLRGMHYQEAPYEQVKLVRCTRGAIYDVIIDLRPASTSFKQWFGVELTAENARMLYVPAGFAHGFQTLADDTEMSYQMSSHFEPASGRGVRWNDPAFGIEWPETDQRIIISRDREYPDFPL
ncbi:MAG: dTDP-4-dehydrorhamnose 3,5-epimerase [Acidobacteriota bacterium]|nr:dTDP-4-dehydrorhamnose 3,5-epimerase [Acidobacteriota bacterium]